MVMRADSTKSLQLSRLLIAAGVALLLLLATDALAQSREFTGKIQSVGGSSITVERGGDRVSFARFDGTRVSGGKGSWSALAAGDWVSVSWKFDDKPPRAYSVRVLPPKGGK